MWHTILQGCGIAIFFQNHATFQDYCLFITFPTLLLTQFILSREKYQMGVTLEMVVCSSPSNHEHLSSFLLHAYDHIMTGEK